MAKRGRKSAAELAITPTIDECQQLCPEGMSAAEVDLFYDTVQRLPAGWFPPESWEQLAAYCRHAVTYRDLSEMVNKARNPEFLNEDDGFETYERLLKLREREGRAMMACARALRLTNQSRYDAKSAHRQIEDNPTGQRPWEMK